MNYNCQAFNSLYTSSKLFSLLIFHKKFFKPLNRPHHLSVLGHLFLYFEESHLLDVVERTLTFSWVECIHLDAEYAGKKKKKKKKKKIK